MTGVILFLCGATAVAVGTWRGYQNAREAIAPFVRDGEPTRTAVDAERPVLARVRVRRFVRGAATSIGWLGVAMYGLFLVASVEGVR